jgi:transposase
MIPFAKKCQKDRPNILVQEDKAPSHAHHYQATVFAIQKVARLTWSGNSPDLSPIEPAWWWLKRRTTAYGAPSKRTQAETLWKQAWRDLPQEKIQQ